MIQRLSIQGLAIIDQLSIEFSKGFNVITGETGAGKSILIRALTFLTGGRASAENIRQGSPWARVSGEFWVPGRHPVLERLEELGVALEPEGDQYPVFLRRQISPKGRSQAWINDLSVTTSGLRDVGRLLIDVFAQHENQRLMDSDLHVGYLDEFLAVAELKEAVGDAYGKCFDGIERVQSILEKFRSGEQNRDFLEFRLEELRKFGPTKEDYQEVATRCQSSKHRVRLREIFQKAVAQLDENGGVGSRVWEAHSALEATPELDSELAAKINELKERAAQAATEIDDLTFELGQFLGRYDINEDELEKAEGRLYGYQKLFRKHNVTEIDELLKVQESLSGDLESVEQVAVRVEDELASLKEHIKVLSQQSKKLTKSRKQAAEIIKKAVEKELQELSMKGSRFEVEFTPLSRPLPALDFDGVEKKLSETWELVAKPLGGLSRDGAEDVQFLLSANPGEPMLPLAKVASGGEISRIMLALKKSLTVDADTCVLVFDEIDTGISGRVAAIVGKKMRQLAKHFQVVCISHLPQVAACADSHYLVKKGLKRKRTETDIVRLSSEESTEEIARLLSGENVSVESIKNAKLLKARAREATVR